MSPTKADFKAVLSQARDLVKEELEQTENVIMQVAKKAPAGIVDRLVSLFSRKGKRIRSTLLCLLANCGTEKPDLNRVAHACAAVELLHLASLVHDDIIDGTDVRRGQKTAHREWGTQIAVLIGDYVLSQSMRCVIDEEANIPAIISDAADKLIVGEILESGPVAVIVGLSRKVVTMKSSIGKTAARH
jgi:Geranylgeranyl pyrophosphate synthase